MGNLEFDRMKKVVVILLVAFFVISATAAAVSASSYKGARNTAISNVQVQVAVNPQINVATATVVSIGGNHPITVDINQEANSWIEQHASFRSS